MIKIELNNCVVMKFDKSNYQVYPSHGCLYVEDLRRDHNKIIHLIPLNSIKLVSFD